jgi:hypothetical protein
VTDIVVVPKPTFEEWRSAQRSIFPSRALLALLAVVFGAVVAVATVEGVDARVLVAVAIAVYLAIYFWSNDLAQKSIYGRYASRQCYATSYAFGESGIVGKCRVSRTDFDWATFEAVSESRDVWHLQLRQHSVLCIPKRDVPEDRREELEALFVAKIPK